jgi:hypothetical protein
MKLIAYLRAASKSSVSFAEKRKARFHFEQHFSEARFLTAKAYHFTVILPVKVQRCFIFDKFSRKNEINVCNSNG